MSAEQRRRRILEVVQERGSIRVTELGAELGVAPVTARRDVAALATQGLLRHVYGSVSWPERTPAYLPVPVDRARPAADPDRAGPVLGMLIPSAAYYFAEVVRGAQSAAAAAGARLVLGISGYRPSEDEAQVGRLLENGVDGLLLTPSWDPDSPVAEQADRFSALAVPCVLVERRVSSVTAVAAGLDRVCSDHAYGAFLAVRRLAELGHRRIALAAHRSPTATSVRAGYLAALDALELGEPPVAVIDTYSLETNPVGFETAVKQLFEAVHGHGVSAVVVHNDVDAIMLTQRLLDLGVQVPRDLSVIAYDDEVAAFADTPLSAVAPPKREVGESAVDLLLRRLAEERDPGRDGSGPAPRRHLDLLPRLTVRDSCRPFEER
ncbi:LacI family DNA-binding transcriptional regulator [Streptacidiphilus sp. PAMC 29251]